MARSYRRPYMAVTGVSSARYDKKCAARGIRAAHRQSLRHLLKTEAYEEYLPPHRYECQHNNTWNWRRDGGKCYCGTTEERLKTEDAWYVAWYRDLCRK